VTVVPTAVGSFPEVRHEIGLHVHPAWRGRRDNYQAHGDLPLLIGPISQMLRTGNVNPEMVPLVWLSRLLAGFLDHSQCVPLFHLCVHSPAMTDAYFVSATDGLRKFVSKRDASEVEPHELIAARTRVMP
jgi:hypothetical protein